MALNPWRRAKRRRERPAESFCSSSSGSMGGNGARPAIEPVDEGSWDVLEDPVDERRGDPRVFAADDALVDLALQIARVRRDDQPDDLSALVDEVVAVERVVALRHGPTLLHCVEEGPEALDGGGEVVEGVVPVERRVRPLRSFTARKDDLRVDVTTVRVEMSVRVHEGSDEGHPHGLGLGFALARRHHFRPPRRRNVFSRFPRAMPGKRS